MKQRKGIEDDDAYDDYYLDIDAAMDSSPGTNCIKIGLPGKLILLKRKGLQEVLFS